MWENITIIETFNAQDTNFIATATKKEVAIWTVGEQGFDEVLRKNFEEFLDLEDSIVYIKALIEGDQFKMMIGFEYGWMVIWDL